MKPIHEVIKLNRTEADVAREWAGVERRAPVAPLEVLPVLKARPNMAPFWVLVAVVFVGILSLGVVL